MSDRTDDERARLVKRATGLSGLDTVTNGGLPAAGATLVLGEPGSGKTVLGLQILAFARARGEAGILVSFEESPTQVVRDAASFSWGEGLGRGDGITLVDARPGDAEVSGGFDLEGLLAALGTYADRDGATWVVLDGIDRLLSLEPDQRTAVEHVARLNDWCEGRGLSLLLTAKQARSEPLRPSHLDGVEFMLGTIIVLSTELVGRRLNRRFRIAKYRGTAHAADELALVIDDDGVHIPHDDTERAPASPASLERVGTGIARLDRVLAGGPYRGSTTLISGQPGTAKTTLAICLARAAAERGERVLYVSFDELADRIVRNVASVGLDLRPHVDAGTLRIQSRDAWQALIEAHFIAIQRILGDERPDFLVIDPVSALVKAAGAEGAFATTERLLATARARGVTTVLTSLTESETPESEATLSHVSTLADTWITLGYQVRGGERNRTLSVVKSRGTPHSNQVRELLLSSAGLDLADVYEYGSEVLLGTARLQKESETAMQQRREGLEREQRRRDLERQAGQARLRATEAQSEMERLEEQLERERREASDSAAEQRGHHDRIVRRRDPAREHAAAPGDTGTGNDP